MNAPADRPPVTRTENALAVMFADVAGSTRLYETLGNAQALVAVGRCLDAAKAVCAAHGGRVVKTIGDEAMMAFRSADDCTEAAAELMGRIAALPPAGATQLGMRVGYHIGPAIEADDGDVFGDSVNVAARMVALAKAGQVITSGDTVTTLSPWLRARLRQIDSFAVKGKSQEIGIFELMWQESDELTALSTRPKLAPARLRLTHGDVEFEIADSQSGVTLGRDPACDVVLLDRMASRTHAKIERRRDKFVIIDQSSNGTYVAVTGEREILLRHEELILRGGGHITFGHANPAGLGEVLRFQCFDP